jgi:hypothetical protein
MEKREGTGEVFMIPLTVVSLPSSLSRIGMTMAVAVK